MKLIIDGYNVLKMIYPQSEVNEHVRERFINKLVCYTRISGNSAVIVFDGGDDIRPVFLQRKGVVVVYSGYRESADTVIKGLLEEERKHEVLLISTDRELNKYAENFDIPSMESRVFYGYLRDRLEHQQKPRATSLSTATVKKYDMQKTSPELDALLQEAAGGVLYKKEDSAVPDDHATSRKKESKITKRLEKMVKKL